MPTTIASNHTHISRWVRFKYFGPQMSITRSYRNVFDNNGNARFLHLNYDFHVPTRDVVHIGHKFGRSTGSGDTIWECTYNGLQVSKDQFDQIERRIYINSGANMDWLTPEFNADKVNLVLDVTRPLPTLDHVMLPRRDSGVFYD